MEDRFANLKRKAKGIRYYKNILKNSVSKFHKVVFTSGEPTLNEHLPELISYAKQLGYNEISLITNGRLLAYRSLCNDIITRGLNHIGISIHAHTKELQEAITRTPGSFEQTVKGLSNVGKSRNQLNSFTIHTTITKMNYKHLEALYDFFMGFQPDSIVFNIFNPRDKAMKKFDLLMPKYSEVAGVLYSIYKKGKNIFSITGMPPCNIQNMQQILGSLEDTHIWKGNDFGMDSLRGKAKTVKCNSCRINHQCQGMPKIYLDKFGDKEFEPVK